MLTSGIYFHNGRNMCCGWSAAFSTWAGASWDYDEMSGRCYWSYSRDCVCYSGTSEDLP